MRDLEITDDVRRRAQAKGAAGEAWLAGLPELVDGLAADWGLEIGPTLTGGTEAFVAEARMGDGREAVLKVLVVDQDPSAAEIRSLLAARGRGYPRLYRHDRARAAMLMERLGAQLISFGWPVAVQLEVICGLLKDVWRPPPLGEAFQTGAEKADWLARYIGRQWPALGKPCSDRAVEQALAFAQTRAAAFDPAHAVLAHGDAHAWNTLAVRGSDPQQFKLIDPDGVFVEPAYDLAIPMREWAAELLAGDPVALGLERCRLLSRLTGVPPGPIWQWGFIERVSTGLMALDLGWAENGRDFLAVADAWATIEGP